MTQPLTEEVLAEGLRTNEDEDPSFAKMMEFGHTLTEDESSRADTLQRWMSIENTMRFIAVDRTMRADDGPFHFYCNSYDCGNHNVYIYEEQDADRLYLIPWDLDNGFVVLDGGLGGGSDQFLKVLDEWDDTTVTCAPHAGAAPSSPWQMPPSCDPLFRTCAESYSEEFDADVAELLAGPFSDAVVSEMLDTWAAQISDTVTEAYELNAEQRSPTDWASGLENLRSRVDYLRAQAGDE